DLVSDRVAGVIVVAGGVGKGPRVGVGAGIGVRRTAEIQAAQGHVVDTLSRAGGNVRVAIVAHIVRSHCDRGVSLCDLVGDRAAGVVVVACAVGEGSGVGVGTGVGVRRAAEVQPRQGHITDLLGRARRDVRYA